MFPPSIPLKETLHMCKYAQVPTYTYTKKSLHECLCYAVGAKPNHIQFSYRIFTF